MSPDETFLVELVGALHAARLESLIVGATAAVLQGAPVMTQDIDLLVRDTPRNRQKLEKLAHTLGAASPVRLSDLSQTVRLMGLAVSVDVIFDEISGGLSFGSLRSRSITLKLGSQEISVASLKDVIESKRAAGRPKDLAQLPILEDTLRVREALLHR